MVEEAQTAAQYRPARRDRRTCRWPCTGFEHIVESARTFVTAASMLLL